MSVLHSRPPLLALLALVTMLLAGCSSAPPRDPPIDPDVARAEIRARIPAAVANRDGWAIDMFAAFEALEVRPTARNVCAVVAVIQQESGFQVDPVVAGLPAMAHREIDERAARHHVPRALVSLALNVRSPDGRTYAERVRQAKTERALSEMFEDFIGAVPLGRQLFADLNPVRTGGPMQVGISFADAHVKKMSYPFPLNDGVRSEVFTRRGGLYFGIAHLLAYPVSYDSMLYRFADFNAGHYASRNAAFQQAVSSLSGTRLAIDGDLLLHGSSEPSQTELAVRRLAIELGERQIRRDLERGTEHEFEETETYRKVFEMADARAPAPRAVVPDIRLQSVKISRKLTTKWFAQRVDGRYRSCLKN
ncbi:MAG: DUF1615 domain-containing protein [Steroidobacteraceae bacterium]|nr:DUF1615 domain-containing protein [Steroidobacteraceae bacterium]